MQSLDIALKGIKALLFYNTLREGVPKLNGTWEKRIQLQVVITSGVRDKVRQGMLFSSNCVYRNKMFFTLIHTHTTCKKFACIVIWGCCTTKVKLERHSIIRRGAMAAIIPIVFFVDKTIGYVRPQLIFSVYMFVEYFIWSSSYCSLTVNRENKYQLITYFILKWIIKMGIITRVCKNTSTTFNSDSWFK